MEWFLEAELLINITEHVLVPQHLTLSKEEKTILLKKVHARAACLPPPCLPPAPPERSPPHTHTRAGQLRTARTRPTTRHAPSSLRPPSPLPLPARARANRAPVPPLPLQHRSVPHTTALRARTHPTTHAARLTPARSARRSTE